MADVSKQIIDKAIALGVAMAGIADIGKMKVSPSCEFLEKAGAAADGVLWKPEEGDITEIKWPDKAVSALILAVSHPEDQPELDYWSESRGGTPGNRLLMDVNREMSSWIKATFGFETHRMPYAVESGGIYLKDAAVLAGLGCIGRNNVLITPTLGPRVRLRGMLIEAALPPTGPIDFDPCDDCDAYCRQACPRNAFEKAVHDAVELRLGHLPGRDGTFSRARCKVQMDKDVAVSAVFAGVGGSTPSEGTAVPSPKRQVKYCRRCEFACPIGRE